MAADGGRSERALRPDQPGRGGTVIGNDVWLGYRATVMPGVRIGHGAIVKRGSIVVDEMPGYGVVGGNPGPAHPPPLQRPARLPAVAWWDRPLEHITEHVRTIMSGSVGDLAAATPEWVSRRRPCGRRAAG